MKKGLVIILAVAILGGLGVYAKAHYSTNDTAVQGDQTAIQTASTPATSTGSNNETASTSYKDGSYTGDSVNTIYGAVQVQAVVRGGKITDIIFLRMPSDRGHTDEVTAYSEPLLKQQTLKNQSASVDFVSGATQTSEGYEQSLQAALNQAV
jgi:uncharacterized protein with FMN-binding domain